MEAAMMKKGKKAIMITKHKDKYGYEESQYVIDLNKIKSDDPLAFAYGYSQGRSGIPISKEKGLAPEYVRGWKEGRKKLKKVI